jgi:8-oxo-dGTP pyrophosphatase MutT (NUDIX family)
MDIHRIKKVLSHHTPPEDEWKGAVLFLLNEDHVFLIKRSENMPTHGGHIAFVGGFKKEGETSPWEVAQREFEEETHHPRLALEFMGYLPVVMTAQRQPIVPVVGRLAIPTTQFLQKIKSNGEWDDVLAYPWSEIMQEANWEFAWRHGDTRGPVLFHPIRIGTYLPIEQNAKAHLLWGATAQMIWYFLRVYLNS